MNDLFEMYPGKVAKAIKISSHVRPWMALGRILSDGFDYKDKPNFAALREYTMIK